MTNPCTVSITYPYQEIKIYRDPNHSLGILCQYCEAQANLIRSETDGKIRKYSGWCSYCWYLPAMMSEDRKIELVKDEKRFEKFKELIDKTKK